MIFFYKLKRYIVRNIWVIPTHIDTTIFFIYDYKL